MSVIFLECNNDEFLIKSLGFLKKQISHERCKGEVVKKVGKKTHAIGIIDEDDRTNEPNDIKKYSLNQTRGCIKLLQKKR